MKNKPNLVVMLTHNDVTVTDAHEIFENCQHLNVQHWGFKNVGLPRDKMKCLVQSMKSAGKTTYLEVVTYDEESCQAAAEVAVECGFDVLMGTIFYDTVYAYLKKHNMAYSPFVGKVSGSPSILEGSNEEIITEAKNLMDKGIDGFDILAYRHVEDGEKLARDFCAAISAKVCIAGSIASFERIDTMYDIAPWGFTMGSALFTKNFVPNGTFVENLAAVIAYMDKK